MRWPTGDPRQAAAVAGYLPRQAAEAIVLDVGDRIRGYFFRGPLRGLMS
jgi:hypothetical protein